MAEARKLEPVGEAVKFAKFVNSVRFQYAEWQTIDQARAKCTLRLVRDGAFLELSGSGATVLVPLANVSSMELA